MEREIGSNIGIERDKYYKYSIFNLLHYLRRHKSVIEVLHNMTIIINNK